ncbi:internalin G [Methylomonas koyamae]|uniref:Internalin G n=1 Tax=Methylomonas koyamae TaxID=702114 RepID=A0AA91DC00_9GAMM|nr:internalin G [Methylomonas koyamae]
MLLLDRPFLEAQLGESAQLDLRNISAAVWPTLLSMCRASDLSLYHLTLSSLEGIERLVNTRQLTLEWASKIDDLGPVFRLHQLTSLSIFDFPKLRHLDGIASLVELTELHLSGSRGATNPPLRLASIAPVTQLPNLVTLSLANAKLDDDDITVLARCSCLRHLHLSRQFERAQVAFLAKRLNGKLAEPLAAYFDTNLKCEACHGPRFMFVGRRMPVLCRSCDSVQFARSVAEFERLVHDA